MDNCIFCKIVSGEIPSYKIYEDKNYLAFLDIFPASEGYTLIIPKKHYKYVWDVDDIEGYFKIVKKVANHFRNVTGHDAVYSMIIGEEVPHAHVRIFSGKDKKHRNMLFKFLKDTTSSKPINETKAKRIHKKYKLT